jgi:hypothetical protein
MRFLYTDHRNMKKASTGRYESLRFETGQHGFTSFSFIVAAAGRQGSVRMNQECMSIRVETGENSLLWGLHYGNAVTHSRFSNRVYTELKPYRPCSTSIYSHRNPYQFLMDSESTKRRRKKVWSCSKFLHGFRFRSSIHIDPVLTALTQF